MRRARAGGPKALQARRRPGAARRLTPEQLAHLPELLHRGAEAYGFRGQLWTRGRVAAIIGSNRNGIQLSCNPFCTSS